MDSRLRFTRTSFLICFFKFQNYFFHFFDSFTFFVISSYSVWRCANTLTLIFTFFFLSNKRIMLCYKIVCMLSEDINKIATKNESRTQKNDKNETIHYRKSHWQSERNRMHFAMHILASSIHNNECSINSPPPQSFTKKTITHRAREKNRFMSVFYDRINGLLESKECCAYI